MDARRIPGSAAAINMAAKFCMVQGHIGPFESAGILCVLTGWILAVSISSRNTVVRCRRDYGGILGRGSTNAPLISSV